MRTKRFFSVLFALPPLAFALLYGGGYVAQFIRNYRVWSDSGGTPGDGTSPQSSSFAIGECFKAMFTMPSTKRS